MAEEPLVSIRIVKVPTGEAPDEIRKEWLGLVLFPAMAHDVSGAFDLETGRTTPSGRCYVVLASVAIRVLASRSPTAAGYFERHWQPWMAFAFGADEVEVIEHN